LFSAVLFLAACNNNKPKDSITISTDEGKGQVTIDPTQMQKAAEDMEKQKEKLGSLSPLSADQLKAMIPEQLMGTPRTDLDVADAMGASVASADYKINDSTKIELSIIDCAGPGGTGLYNTQYLGMLNIQEEDEEEYTKTIDFNGGKAFENCKKDRIKCTLTYFGGGRFLIALEGDNVGIDALKQAAKGLDIK
jgi:hypothetical protein